MGSRLEHWCVLATSSLTPTQARGSTLRDRLTAIRIQASRRAVESELRERSLGLVLLDAWWLSS